MSKLVRMSDIAQRLHISTVTVSKALSGKDGVSDALRLKIQQTAEQMGYQRKIIQAERCNRFTVAVLIDCYHVNRKNSFSWTIYEGLLTALEIRGHTGKLEDVPASDVERGILPESIQQHQVDGIILLCPFPMEYCKKLQETGIPIVVGDVMDANFPQDTVLSDSYYGMYTLTNYILQKGHRDIMFVGAIHKNPVLADRFYGFCRAMMEAGISVTPNHILVDRDENGHYALSASQLSHIPTAFICSRDSSAYQLLKILKEKNIRVPEDVSITGFDDYILSSLCTPKITTYSIDVAKLTDSCIWLLLDRITQPDRPLRHIVISGKIMERDSVRTLSTNLEPR